MRLSQLWYRFIQWLWFGPSVLSDHPKFKVLKTRGLIPIKLHRSDGVVYGDVGFPGFWVSMQARFLGLWASRYFCGYYHRSNAWALSHWKHVPCYKNPCDLMIYQEIVVEHKPDIIIECGTFCGGSALFLADVCDLMGEGLVATIDINHDIFLPVESQQILPFGRKSYLYRPEHERILYIIGQSDTDPSVVEHLKQFIDSDTQVMVILDSAHDYEHVKKQLELYSPLVTPGQYLIVEDTNAGWQVKKEVYKHDTVH
jgi:cephalosporin hydroxylase